MTPRGVRKMRAEYFIENRISATPMVLNVGVGRDSCEVARVNYEAGTIIPPNLKWFFNVADYDCFKCPWQWCSQNKAARNPHHFIKSSRREALSDVQGQRLLKGNYASLGEPVFSACSGFPPFFWCSASSGGGYSFLGLEIPVTLSLLLCFSPLHVSFFLAAG